MPDHVHILIEVEPQFGVHKAIKRINGMKKMIIEKKSKDLVSLGCLARGHNDSIFRKYPFITDNLSC